VGEQAAEDVAADLTAGVEHAGGHAENPAVVDVVRPAACTTMSPRSSE
jgi:hypothetical protein